MAIQPVGTVTPASAWVRELPKIELHLHLEGAMRPATVCSLTQNRLGWEGPLEAGWEQSYFTYSDFAGFMEQLTPRLPYTPEEYGRVAAECFEDLAAQRVIYAEVSLELPVFAVGDDTRFWPVLEAIEEERRWAERRWPIRINLIAGLQRKFPLELALYRVELAARAHEQGIAIAGIDLHGDELSYPGAPFAPAYRRAAELGLGLRAHAGEASGVESMWDAINVLGARRIAHGVRATEDRDLLERLQERDVTLELCLTSNVRTAVVPDLASHPFRLLFDLGVPVSVNSDDPLPFFTDIERELRLLVDEFQFAPVELYAITRYAAQAAFIGEAEGQELLATIAAAYLPGRELAG